MLKADQHYILLLCWPHAGGDGHLVLVAVELDVVEVSPQSSLKPQPALIEPGLQLLTVVDQLKHLELGLQLLPPETRLPRWTSATCVARFAVCLDGAVPIRY